MYFRTLFSMMAKESKKEALETNRDSKLKYVCVTKFGNKYYYPKTLPKQRSPLAAFILSIIVVALITVDLLLNDNPKTLIIGAYAGLFLLTFFYELILRLVLFVEECNHLTSRYLEENQNKLKALWNLLKDCFMFSNFCVMIFVIAVVIIVHLWSTSELFQYKFRFLNVVCCMMPFIYFLEYLVDFKTSPLYDSLWIAKNNGLDYGSGMAYSFFHGYLNLILPKTGTNEKDLKELMQDYEDDNDIHFAAYKIFILIPKSLTCFVSLGDCLNNSSIEHRRSLNEKTRTVAGVQDRVYKNSVYTITTINGKKVNVCAEYATPLKTFKDVVKSNSDHNEFYKRHKNDIILQFYLTLKNVLEQKQLNGLCELIYYDDKDEHGEYYDVGKIILNRLKRLKKEKSLNKQ